MDNPESLSPTQQLEQWQAQQAQAPDPAAFALMQALARRLPTLQGSARQAVQARLQAQLERHAQRLQADTALRPARPDAPGPLTDLLAHARARAVLQDAPDDGSLAYPELPLLDEVRAIWGRLNAERQLRQSIEQLPENAGPLNSDHVVLRALTHMRELSPDYLHHFMVYGETLAWLERMSPAPGAPARDGKPGAKNAGKPAAKAAAKPRKPRQTVAEAAPDEAGGER